jgi:hypothetical protein
VIATFSFSFSHIFFLKWQSHFGYKQKLLKKKTTCSTSQTRGGRGAGPTYGQVHTVLSYDGNFGYNTHTSGRSYAYVVLFRRWEIS